MTDHPDPDRLPGGADDPDPYLTTADPEWWAFTPADEEVPA